MDERNEVGIDYNLTRELGLPRAVGSSVAGNEIHGDTKIRQHNHKRPSVIHGLRVILSKTSVHTSLTISVNIILSLFLNIQSISTT
jgi:hypothetical protein